MLNASHTADIARVVRRDTFSTARIARRVVHAGQAAAGKILALLVSIGTMLMALGFCQTAQSQPPTAPVASDVLPNGALPSAGAAAAVPNPGAAGLPGAPNFDPTLPIPAANPESPPGDEILDVKIVGLKQMTVEEFYREIRTRPGRTFNPSIIEEDVRRLNATRRFLDIKTLYERTRPGGIVVIFQVAERPRLQYIRFAGNTEIKSSKLRRESELKSGDPLDPSAVREAAFRVEEYYRQKGYAQASVTILEGTKLDDQGARFLVNEGPRQRISSVEFLGNSIATDARLKTQIQTKPPILYLFKGFVEPDKIEADIGRVTDYYRNLGYLTARVGRELQFNEDQTWAKLTFVIDEGPRFRVRSVSFVGNKKYTSGEWEEKLKLRSGDYFDRLNLNIDLGTVRDYYGQRGHIFADIRPDTRFILEEPGQVDLVYEIDEGSRWRVGRIDVQISGDNPHTRIRTVLNRIDLRPGDIVDTKKIRDGERRLKASSIFATDPIKGTAPKIEILPPDKDPESVAGNKPRKVRRQSPDSVDETRVDESRVAVVYRVVYAGREYWFYRAEELEKFLASFEPAPSADESDEADEEHDTETNVASPLASRRDGSSVRKMIIRYQSPDLPWRRPGEPPRNAVAPARSAPVRTVSETRATSRGASVLPPSRRGERSIDARSSRTPAYRFQNQNYRPSGGEPMTRFDPDLSTRTSGTGADAGFIQDVPSGPTVSSGTGFLRNVQYMAPAAPGVLQPFAQPGPVFGPPPGDDGRLLPPVGESPYFEEPEGEVTIVPQVEETQTGRLMLGVGVNSDAGLVGSLMIDEQNFDLFRVPTSWNEVVDGTAFRGAGQQFRFEAVPGTQLQRYVLSFREPYLLDTPVSLSTSGFFFDRRYREWQEQRFGGRVGLGYQLTPDLSISGTFRGEKVKVRNPRVPTPTEIEEVLGDNDLFGFRFGITHDTRDSAFLPTEGHLVELGYEQVVGSFDYPIATLEARRYFLLHERPDRSGRHVLGVGARVGVAGTNTPVYDHFFAGGYSTLRGFDFRGAGPRSLTVSVGGEFMFLGSVEYMIPLTADDSMRLVTFVDFGTVESRPRFDSDTFRVVPGIGLRITVPGMGPAPIALDLAVPVHHAPGDDIDNFSFFVGFFR